MASTFSDLKIELIATGEQSGTWGNTTNTNLGTAIEQAITGSGDVPFSSADVTLTLTDTNASQTARNLRLNLTGTSGGARNLIVPAIEKQYIVNNGLADTVTVKNSTGTGVAVPAGKTMVVFNNATNVVDVTNYASSLALGTALPITSGGTGQTTYTDGQLLIGNSSGNTLTKATLTQGSGVTITNGNGSITIAATGLGGDVVGPASSTDNAIVRFDGTTGKLVQNSSVTVADDGTTVISANSTTDALRITQTGTGNALVVEDSANPDATPFVVNADGRLIVGSLTDRLGSVQIAGNPVSAATTQKIFGFANDSRLRLSRANASETVIASGDNIGQLAFDGYDGTSYIEAARITAAVDGTPGTNDMPGRLVFSTTADGASTPTERMRIDNAGRVGIGAGAFGSTQFLLTGAAGFDAAQTTVYVARANTTMPSTGTGAQDGFGTTLVGNAASHTVNSVNHFHARSYTIGASQTVTNQYGFVAGSGLTGATNNYGFYSNIASGTGRWNFFANGTANNAFAGNTSFGGTTAPTVAVDVTGTVRAQAAATQDAVVLAGRAGGTSSYAATITPATLSANRTVTIPDETFTVGYRNIPPVGTKTGSYILAVGDVGKYVQVSTGGSITIPDATFSEGDAISIFNNTSAGITITCSITTAYIAGTDSDKATMTLATRGMATILFISGTVCVVSGNVS